MTDTQRGVIALIRSALTERSVPLPVGFSFADALPIAAEHQTATLIYDGALRCGISPELPEMRQLSLAYLQNYTVSEQQLALLEEIAQAFEKSGIDYLPIKGSVVKHLYPKPELRIMTDCDILIRENQYDVIRPVMNALGFESETESDHEYKWTRSGHLVELHKRLIPSYNRDFNAYYGSGWHFARPSERPHCFQLCREDTFLFLFVHLAKHYRDCGIGLRHIADIFVCRSVWCDMDESYILRELEKLKLRVFYQNILQTLAVWFADGESAPAVELITDTVFRSGSYGDFGKRLLSDGLKKSKLTGRSRDIHLLHWLSAIFSPLRSMRLRYPVLKKMPVLLPVFWVVRIVEAPLFHRDHIAAVYRTDRALHADEIDAYQGSLNRVGLDYYF